MAVAVVSVSFCVRVGEQLRCARAVVCHRRRQWLQESPERERDTHTRTPQRRRRQWWCVCVSVRSAAAPEPSSATDGGTVAARESPDWDKRLWRRCRRQWLRWQWYWPSVTMSMGSALLCTRAVVCHHRRQWLQESRHTERGDCGGGGGSGGAGGVFLCGCR